MSYTVLRVVASFIEDATARDLSFTTVEYVHTPARGVAGYWGTFELKKNLRYDKADNRKGTMFIRHSAVTRPMIALYNVGTFVEKTKVVAGQPPKTRLRV